MGVGGWLETRGLYVDRRGPVRQAAGSRVGASAGQTIAAATVPVWSEKCTQ
jgi:hypothetical protein